MQLVTKALVILLLAVALESFSRRGLAGMRGALQHKHALRMSSSPVGGGPAVPEPPPKAFIISPSEKSGLDELLILQNFNQIQSGDKKALGIIGTQELGENHRQM